MMSHEIRTPMNAIINMNAFALESELPPKAHQYISVAHSSARNLLGILNDILDFSKIEADKLELEEAPFSVREVLEEVTETFRATVMQKHVELVAHAVPDGPRPPGWRRASFPPGAHESRRERLQVHARRRGRAARGTAGRRERDRRSGESARDRAGQRDRHPAGAAGQAVSGVHAGRQLHVATVRRHGPGAGDQPPTGAAHGRRPHLRERPGVGTTFCFTARFAIDAQQAGGRPRRFRAR